MQRNTFVAGSLIVVLSAVSASATMFVSVKKSDPISGETVTVHDVLSYGSYIYDAPSKYDQVFWPFTEESWISFCPASGYASFCDDFEKLTDEEKTRLSLWLKDNYKASEKPTTHKEKLAWLEKVYAQREKDDEFWSRFWRLMAYVYADEPQTSLAYVAKALPLLAEQLQAGPEGVARIRVLFLLGEYHRRTGDARAARRYFRQAKAAEYTDEDGAKRTGHPYFLKLVQEREPSSHIWLVVLAGTACALALVTVLFLRQRGKTRSPSPPADSSDDAPVPHH